MFDHDNTDLREGGGGRGRIFKYTYGKRVISAVLLYFIHGDEPNTLGVLVVRIYCQYLDYPPESIAISRLKAINFMSF